MDYPDKFGKERVEIKIVAKYEKIRPVLKEFMVRFFINEGYAFSDIQEEGLELHLAIKYVGIDDLSRFVIYNTEITILQMYQELKSSLPKKKFMMDLLLENKEYIFNTFKETGAKLAKFSLLKGQVIPIFLQLFQRLSLDAIRVSKNEEKRILVITFENEKICLGMSIMLTSYLENSGIEGIHMKQIKNTLKLGW
jgi:hypothetical protein